MSTTLIPPDALRRAAEAYGRGDLAAAERACGTLLDDAPDQVEAIFLLALIAHRRGEPAAALAGYERVLALDPDHLSAVNNRGLLQAQRGDFAAALASYDRALALAPNDAEMLNNRGIALGRLGREDEALASYDRALAAKPGHIDALNNRGNVLYALGRFADALADYDRALARAPARAGLLVHRGNVLKALRRHAEALASYDRALALAPDDAGAHYNRGLALFDVGRFEDAVAAQDRALAARPAYVEALCARAAAFTLLDRRDEAFADFDRALAHKSDHAPAWYGRGVLFAELGRVGDARADYARAVAVDPDHADAHFGHSMCLLTQGDYAAGWREYEWRWRASALKGGDRDFTRPLWRGGAPLAGNSILLHGEQGFGDTIQFCRYAKLVAGQGARVVLEVQPELVSLIASLDPAIRVIARGGEAGRDCDFGCPLLSLPLACGTTLDTIPAGGPYLGAPDAKVQAWRDRLGAGAGLRVGLVWAGNPRKGLLGANRVDRQRSIAFERLAPLWALDDVAFYSLQKGEDAVAELRASPHRARVDDWTDELRDFTDTAALIANLDLVIAVDTAVAHLAGALGKPLWLMNRFNTCWRWFIDRDDSPWYPTARIFRQPTHGDWEPVIAAIAAALRARAAGCAG